MSCYSPLNGYLPVGGGKLMDSPRGDCRYVTVPCGGCIGCRLNRANGWAVRMMHEAKLYDRSSFLTLTYKDAPAGSSLNYRDFQLFMKKLRKSLAPNRVTFYCAGEYGSVTWRPHFHAAVFGYWPSDCVYYRKSPAGFRLYRSDSLDGLWSHGLAAVGNLDFSSAAYIARYCMKKITGDLAEWHYTRVDPESGEVFHLTPEFAHMSMGAGLGSRFLDKYKSDVFPRDYVVMDGHKVPVPKYYLNRLRKSDLSMMAGLEADRQLRSLEPERQADCTPERLAVRCEVVTAKMRSFHRDME